MKIIKSMYVLLIKLNNNSSYFGVPWWVVFLMFSVITYDIVVLTKIAIVLIK